MSNAVAEKKALSLKTVERESAFEALVNGAIEVNNKHNDIQKDGLSAVNLWLNDYLYYYSNEVLTAEQKREKVAILFSEVVLMGNKSETRYTKHSVGVIVAFVGIVQMNQHNKTLHEFLMKHILGGKDITLETYKRVTQSVKKIVNKEPIDEAYPDVIATWHNLASVDVPREGQIRAVKKGGLVFTEKQIKKIGERVTYANNINKEVKEFTNAFKSHLQGLKLKAFDKETAEKAVSELLPELLKEYFEEKEKEAKEKAEKEGAK